MGLAGSSDLARARVLDGMGGRLALRTSLVVTTYNRPRALGVVLDSVLHQRLHPGDVVGADDGSGTDTTEVVAAFAARAPFRVRHCWQEDLGFRVAASRNRALAVAEGDYLVMVDGDLVLHGRFLEDHLEVARPGRFVQGSRVLLSKRTTVRVLSRRPVRLGPLGPGLRNRFNAVHSRTLCRLASRESADVFRVRSANLACWRADVLRGTASTRTSWDGDARTRTSPPASSTPACEGCSSSSRPSATTCGTARSPVGSFPTIRPSSRRPWRPAVYDASTASTSTSRRRRGRQSLAEPQPGVPWQRLQVEGLDMLLVAWGKVQALV